MDEKQATENLEDAGPREGHDEVRALARQLARALQAFKLYPEGNSLRLKMFMGLVQSAHNVFDREEAVVFQIEPQRLLWQGEAVLDLSDQESTFVSDLYQDGARQLGLARGIDAGELEALLRLLRSGGEPTRGVVDALWEADLPHVVHLAVDGFTELLEGETGEEQSLTLANRFERLVTDLVGMPEPEGSAATAQSSEAAPPTPEPAEDTLIRVSDSIASPLKALLQQPSHRDDEALDRWREETLETREDDLLLAVEDLILYWLEHPATPLSDDELVSVLARLNRRWLARGRFAVAGELLTRLQRLRFDAPERAAVAQAVLQESGGRVLRDLLTTEDGMQDAVWDAGEAVSFFERHLRVSDEELVALLDLELSGQRERLMAHMLTHRMSQRPDFWAAHMKALPAGLAAGVLASLSTLYRADAQILGLFHSALGHPDPAAALAALRCYPGPHDEEVQDRVIEHLDGDSLALRCAAIDWLSRSGEGSLGPFLVNRMRREGPALLPEEIETLTRGILRLGPNRYAPFIRAQLEEIGVGRRRRLDADAVQRAQAVLSALALTRQPAPIELLREVRQNAKGELRKWCDDLWRTVVAEWSPEEADAAEPEATPAAVPPEVPAVDLPPPPLAGLRELPEELPEGLPNGLEDPEQSLVILFEDPPEDGSGS